MSISPEEAASRIARMLSRARRPYRSQKANVTARAMKAHALSHDLVAAARTGADAQEVEALRLALVNLITRP